MKKLILGLLAVAAIGAAVPASAQVVVREHRNGAVTIRPAGVVVDNRNYHNDRRGHQRHRVVWFDHAHHRHVTWR
ncbi:MAG: hypothetical protein JWO72_3216 [Caulobacteraceae bacterium]|jgi:hypothetical protein|nr:hypothetical protein [Caulobacteraceae bacterium]